MLCHEFLHVLLRHTSLQGPLTPAASPGAGCGDQRDHPPAAGREVLQHDGELLRGSAGSDEDAAADAARGSRGGRSGRAGPAAGSFPAWWQAWRGLYDGKLLADDIEQLAKELSRPGGGEPVPDTGELLGNHETMRRCPRHWQQALDRARKEMNGGGIWRNAGPGANPYEILVNPKQVALSEWKKRTLGVLRKHLEPAPGAPRSPVPVSARLPVLSPSDRRAFLRSTWSPFLPEAEWAATVRRAGGPHAECISTSRGR